MDKIMTAEDVRVLEAFKGILYLQNLGWAIAAFEPSELKGANPNHVEERMIVLGYGVIDSLRDPNYV